MKGSNYHNRLNRIEQISYPVKNVVYMVDCVSDGYIVKNPITGITKKMSKNSFDHWAETLGPEDVIIIDDIKE